MTANVEIQLRADVDKAIAALKRVDGQLKNTGDAAKKQSNLVSDLKGSWTTALGVVGGATALFYTLDKTLGKCIDKTVDYSETVRDMTRWTGTSAEETSRLIQAADDSFISQDRLTQIMKMAVRQGFLPTIDNVKKLADQYNALSDPMAKNQLLIKTLGRNGLEMGKMLEKGSVGIQKSADQADRLALTLSGKNLDAVVRYKEAVDNWNDSVESIEISVGQKAIPVLTDMMNALEEHGQRLQDNDIILQWWIRHLAEASRRTEETTALLLGSPPGWDAAAEAARRYGDGVGAAADAQAGVLEGLPDMTSAFKEWTSAAIATQTITALWSQATQDGKISLDELNTIMAIAKETNNAELIPSISEAARNFNIAKGSIDSVTEAISLLPRRTDLTVVTHHYDVYHGGGGTRKRQHGGALSDVTLVGEAGPELIINGMVIPADETRRLLALGLIPAARAQRGTRGGRPGINVGPRAVIPIVGAGGRVGPGAAIGGVSYGGVGGGAAASEQAASQAAQAATQAAIETAQTTATVAAAAIGAQMPATISETVDRQAQALAETQSRETDRLLGALERVDKHLRELPSSISRSVRDAVTQVI